MTDTPVWTQNLEPAHLIGEAFSVIGRTVWVMIGVTLLLHVPLALAAFGFGYFYSDVINAIETGDVFSRISAVFVVAAIAGGLIFMLGTCLVYAAVAQVTLDDAAGRPVAFGAAISSGLRNVVPATAVVIVSGLICAVAAMFLILPGLYLMALWWLAVPAIVEERLSFGSLGRSAALTEGYRWPMVGLVLLYLLVAIGVGMVTAAPESLLVGAGMPGAVISAVVSGLGDAFLSAFGTVTAVLAYNRLRQIKEGGGPSVADVFT